MTLALTLKDVRRARIFAVCWPCVGALRSLREARKLKRRRVGRARRRLLLLGVAVRRREMRRRRCGRVRAVDEVGARIVGGRRRERRISKVAGMIENEAY